MKQKEKIMLGWREWVSLPDLGLPAIKAKVDTGAKTSSIHAFDVEHYSENGVEMVRFLIHPIQDNQDFYIECVSPISDYRQVSDSGGHKEMRYVIETCVTIASHSFPIELTLTDRDTMRYRMLLGRSALKNWAHVDPSVSFLCGKLEAESLYGLESEVGK
ncbi:hypothetical protein J2755_000443 [Methanohalophilus levihalophilus]|uniref:ATP-dependent zinc protease family protein n=1 Tax=Methanohalophilus levihalophilus TaxID=1431282 RepID=UPI001AE6621E|nr:ATP-dependent zinc protease [Methanohalophilus levihalophilus]MBP2029523.1 hypothetical protein [Methanohalophilus levihalophilus]